MGVMDAVKTQAGQVAQKAQQAAQVGQSKVEAALAKRKADGLLRELGTAVYAQRTGRGDGGEVDRLISELRSLEAENADSGSNGGGASASTPAATDQGAGSETE
jgi:hypothetical protein